MQVKSRQRVQDHGEVFTNSQEVNAMLNMVDTEAERIESRFLEPACGDGNFLTEILRRKLETVSSSYGRDKASWQHNAWLATSSIYGVELLEDNADSCRKRLCTLVCNSHIFACEDRFRDAISFLLSKNVVCGDALTMRNKDGEPLTFCEWSFVREERVKRRDYQLSHLLDAGYRVGEQMDIFGGLLNSEYDAKRNEMVPRSIREFPLRNWWEVAIDG